MRFIGIVILFVLGIVTGNILSSMNLNILANYGTRACVQMGSPPSETVVRQLVFEPNGGAYIIDRLSEPPDLSSVEQSTEDDFIESFSYLNPSEVYTNLRVIMESAEFLYARLAGEKSARSYATQHMLVYIKNVESIWFSVAVPEFC